MPTRWEKLDAVGRAVITSRLFDHVLIQKPPGQIGKMLSNAEKLVQIFLEFCLSSFLVSPSRRFRCFISYVPIVVAVF